MALAINNSSEALSALIFALALLFSGKVDAIWNGALSNLMVAASILLCAIGALANCAQKICITKDWVVVICGSDREKLAEVNAMMVRIDMTCMILSPMLAGQLMTSFSVGWSCAFIGLWTFLSFFVEYFLLRAVYESYPALAVKLGDGTKSNQDEKTTESNIAETVALTDNQAIDFPSPIDVAPARNRSTRCPRFLSSLKSGIFASVDGYRIYFRQSVLPAGLALSSLYLTVLGFDGITTVYMLSYGLAENWIAFCNGIGALTAIIGSLAYPLLHRRVGVNRTGSIALTIEWTCLLLPVASIWLPGSNFDPGAVFGAKHNILVANCTQMETWSNNSLVNNGTFGNNVLQLCNNGTGIDVGFGSKCSLTVFLTGIVLSRMGLWMADLSISQIFQEHIAEHERGVVNGVQNSLNNFMNIAKSVLVIILPNPRTFGVLIIISWTAIFAGYCSYCCYRRRVKNRMKD